MSFDFTFRSVQTTKQIRQTIEFLAKQDLKYPRYDEWVQKAEAELFSGYKKAALAYSEGILVGDILWQPHKQFPRVRELKNVRVSKVNRRYIAEFLVRQAECEDRGEFDAIIVDAREFQTDFISLMQNLDYRVVGKLNLYDEDKRDVVLFKNFSSNSQKPNFPFAGMGFSNL